MNTEIRQPAVAGSFYPREPAELAKMIAGMLARAEKPEVSGQIMGLIAPHAGYIYSGPVAAYAYKAIQGLEYKDVIVISPCHVEAFAGAAVYPGEAYVTPLGEIPIDMELSDKIIAHSELVQKSEYGHRAGSRGHGGAEHSLEVQLPFLQTMLGKFRLVAIVMGEQQMDICKALAESIAAACKGRDDVLIVASSDLSHYHDYKTAASLDGRIVDLINQFDYDELYEELRKGKVEACGGGPIISLLMATKMMGADSASVVRYANSGDVSGDSSAVVGYLSALVYRGGDRGKIYELDADSADVDLSDDAEEKYPDIKVSPASGVDFGLTEQDRLHLLSLARQAIEMGLAGRLLTVDKSMFEGVLAEERGAFVTLTIEGRLRGCIGYIRAVKPLYETIAEMAVQAAFHDPRFPPLTAKEFPAIEIQISVLTPMTLVKDAGEIEVGRDGLYITKGLNSGLLLPQVAVDNGWDRETFLAQTCLKAGLPPGSWQEPGTRIQRFQADIFGGK